MTDQRANAIAAALDRRQRRRKRVGLAAAIGLVVLAGLYLRCGRGWGLGGPGRGAGAGTETTSDAGPHRCSLRVTATGITVDGRTATSVEAVTACRSTTGADVVVTGDARQGDWEQLRAALAEAHVPIYSRTP